LANIAEELDIKKDTLKYYLSKYRNEENIDRERVMKTWSDVKPDAFYIDYIKSLGFIRNMPGIEQNGCMKIMKALNRFTSISAHGIMFGTPTAICASNTRPWENRLINDNLQVAEKLKSITETMSFHIGNRKDKAENKIAQWKLFMPTAKYESIIYDSKYYEDTLSYYADIKNSVISVFMSGGSSIGYDSAAKRLVAKHDNLNIIAMYYRYPLYEAVTYGFWRKRNDRKYGRI